MHKSSNKLISFVSFKSLLFKKAKHNEIFIEIHHLKLGLIISKQVKRANKKKKLAFMNKITPHQCMRRLFRFRL